MQPLLRRPARSTLHRAAFIGAIIAAVMVSIVLWERAPRAAVTALGVLVVLVLTTLLRSELKRWR